MAGAFWRMALPDVAKLLPTKESLHIKTMNVAANVDLNIIIFSMSITITSTSSSPSRNRTIIVMGSSSISSICVMRVSGNVSH